MPERGADEAVERAAVARRRAGTSRRAQVVVREPAHDARAGCAAPRRRRCGREAVPDARPARSAQGEERGRSGRRATRAHAGRGDRIAGARRHACISRPRPARRRPSGASIAAARAASRCLLGGRGPDRLEAVPLLRRRGDRLAPARPRWPASRAGARPARRCDHDRLAVRAPGTSGHPRIAGSRVARSARRSSRRARRAGRQRRPRAEHPDRDVLRAVAPVDDQGEDLVAAQHPEHVAQVAPRDERDAPRLALAHEQRRTARGSSCRRRARRSASRGGRCRGATPSRLPMCAARQDRCPCRSPSSTPRAAAATRCRRAPPPARRSSRGRRMSSTT